MANPQAEPISALDVSNISPHASTNTSSSKRRRVACSECRQSKASETLMNPSILRTCTMVRCDASQGSCSRCIRLGLTCETVVGYRRINKRSKMEEIENELQHLKSMVRPNERALENNRPQVVNMTKDALLLSQSKPPQPLNNAQFNLLKPQSYQNVSPALKSKSYLDPQLAPSPPFSNVPSPTQSRRGATNSRSIEAVHLDEAQIDFLFQEFFERYHPFLPFLDPSMSPDECSDASPLLFWSIISIASRRYRADPLLLPSLSKYVTQLAWTTVSDPPILRFEVQALLLICFWQFPSLTTLKADPSLHFVTIAINSAMQSGLHRPDFGLEFGTTKNRVNRRNLTEPEKFEATKTWAACNIVAQHVIGHFGHPPTVSLFDWTVDRACEVGTNYTVSDDIRYHLIMERICYRVAKAMSGNASDPAGLPSDSERYILLSLFEADIDTAEGQFGKHVSVVNQLYVWAARLYTYVFYFFDSSLSDSRRQGVLKAYSAATTLTTKIAAGDTLFDMLETSPFYVYRMLFTAAAVLIKVLNSTYVRYVDFEAGKQVFELSISALRRWSIQDNDKAVRSADMLAQMWPLYSERNARRPEEPSLRFRCRLGTSLLLDLLWHWREELNARGQAPPHSQGGEITSTSNEGVSTVSGTAELLRPNPPGDMTAGRDVAPELDFNQASLTDPWDDFDAIGFDWDWDPNGFTLPS